MFLKAHAVCEGSGPQPSRDHITRLINAMQQQLDEMGQRPLTMETQCWPFGPGKFIARILLETADGEQNRSFASWYEWQHPRWWWGMLPLPEIELDALRHAERRQIPPAPTTFAT
jgi:hypothetical protein